MGLFILPGRLLEELSQLSGYLTGALDIATPPAADSPLQKHYPWIQDIARRHDRPMSGEAAMAVIHRELAVKCARVLADAGVYKQTPEGDAGVLRFLQSIGLTRA